MTWERQAARGEPVPDGLPLEEQMAYLALRNLHRAFHAKAVKKEEAAQEKTRIFALCRQIAEARASWGAIANKHAVMWKRIEAPASEFFKTKDVSKAEETLLILYGLER